MSLSQHLSHISSHLFILWNCFFTTFINRKPSDWETAAMYRTWGWGMVLNHRCYQQPSLLGTADYLFKLNQSCTTMHNLFFSETWSLKWLLLFNLKLSPMCMGVLIFFLMVMKKDVVKALQKLACWHVNWVNAAEIRACGCTWAVITRKNRLLLQVL